MWPGLVLALSLASMGSDRPIRTVSSLDLERYAGQWYGIARYLNRFEKSCACEVTANYERLEDGRVRVVNRYRRADGSLNQAEAVAQVVEGAASARLKVRFAPGWLSFLPFVWANYWVIGLAHDYRWAVVATPDRKYLWIFSRTPQMFEADRAAADAVVKDNGFDLSRLVSTRQEESVRP